MATYNDLLLEHYYLIQEDEVTDITLVQPVMETAKCILLLYVDEVETTIWKKKKDGLKEIIEELSEEQVAEYENLFDNDEDAWSDWDEEEGDVEYEEQYWEEGEEDEQAGEQNKKAR